MDKEKKIDELAKFLINRVVDKTWRPYVVAKEVYNMLIPEGSVVLSMEEYTKWFKKDGYFSGYRDGEDSAVNYYENIALPSKEEETVEKVLADVSDLILNHSGRLVVPDLYEIAEKYGVNIKE